MPLIVYKSSAGSGKTTTLVNEYLKLTLKDPFLFRQVLAITFTNNAANEMKERILLALQKIMSKEAWTDGEFTSLIEELGFEEDVLIEKARTLQKLILHRYDDFAVSTIDSFVHRIIRTFATDVKLPQNFEVVIEQDDIIPDIVDELFSQVGSDKELTEIMVQFVMDQTEDEKNYRLARLIYSFVGEQFKEDGFSFQYKMKHLTAAEFIKIIRKLSKKVSTVRTTLKKFAAEALDIIHENGLGVEDFKLKSSGIYGYFEKVSNLSKENLPEAKKTTIAAIEEDAWTTKSAPQSTKDIIDGIKERLIEKFNQIQEEAQLYSLLNALNKKIYALALTNQIRHIVNEHTERTQKVHISEFNKRISNEIANQPVPFIYERLGIKYQYFLIDEFQDTSILQWNNLLPLVEESLANNRLNLLVGDAKQAIYRFRSGEVDLFVNLPKLFDHDGSADATARENLLIESFKEIPLDKNWRSHSEIVQFNNTFFETIGQDFPEKLVDIYRNHEQQLPKSEKKKGGYVSIQLINAETSKEYEELRLERIVDNVQTMMSTGYRQGDICILCRRNADAVEISSHLIKHKYSVITTESLLLTNSPEVRLTVAFFRLLHQPNEPVIRAEFLHNYYSLKQPSTYTPSFLEVLSDKNSHIQDILEMLDADINLKSISVLPAFEIAEYFIRQLKLFENADTYLRFFLDFVLDAQDNGRSSIDSFLELWEKKKEKLSITMPEGGDAIKVMTVHKAKGLKFEAVIVDIFNRRMNNSKKEFWTDIALDGIDELKVGLLPLTKGIEGAGYGQVYEEEQQKTLLDFVNLVYVAFTRPVSALFLLGQKFNGKSAEKFSGFLQAFIAAKHEWQDEGDQTIEIGELKAPYRKEKKADKEEIVLEQVISNEWKNLIRIATADEVYWEAIDSKPARVYGNLVHAMLSKIYTADDIDTVVDGYVMSAIIDQSEAKELKGLIEKVVHHPRLKPFFSKEVLVKNEVDILDDSPTGKKFQRPDRVTVEGNHLVVIDYKSGEKEKKHSRQLIQYGNAFRKLGYQDISLILVYIGDQIEVVDVPFEEAYQPELF